MSPQLSDSQLVSATPASDRMTDGLTRCVDALHARVTAATGKKRGRAVPPGSRCPGFSRRTVGAIVMDKVQSSALINSFVKFATHSSSWGYVGNVEAYLAHRMA